MYRQAMTSACFGSKIGTMATGLSNIGCGCVCAKDVAMVEKVRSPQA
jgi:hypothetical protein